MPTRRERAEEGKRDDAAHLQFVVPLHRAELLLQLVGAC